MKLFKRDRDKNEVPEATSFVKKAVGSFGQKNTNTFPSFMHKNSENIAQVSFPENYEAIEEKASIIQEGNSLLLSLISEVAHLGNPENFQSIMKSWGATLASQIISESSFLQSEERFTILCTYLNKLFLLHRLGTFECSIEEQNHMLYINYSFTNFDRHLDEVYGEYFSLSFYGELFKVLMSNTVEANLNLQKTEKLSTTWYFTFKG